jgi:hypothetical protein
MLFLRLWTGRRRDDQIISHEEGLPQALEVWASTCSSTRARLVPNYTRALHQLRRERRYDVVLTEMRGLGGFILKYTGVCPLSSPDVRCD